MSDIRDERFVLCAGTKPYKDLMQTIAKHLGVPGPGRAVQPWMAGLAWRLSALVERLFGIRALATRESLANSGAHHAYDGTKIVTCRGGLTRPSTKPSRSLLRLF